MTIKTARARAGLSQQAMSELFGIPKRTIEDWEAGRRKCPDWTENLIVEKLEGIKMRKTYDNLQELTGQESGIVLYGINSLGVSQDGAEMIIGNWTSVNGLPRLDPMGFALLGLGEKLTIDEIADIDDIAEYLDCTAIEDGVLQLPPEIEVVYDRNGDLAEIPGTPGTRYYIRADGGEVVTVIAPNDWA